MDWLIPAAQAHEKWFVTGAKAYAIPSYFYTVNPLTVGAAIFIVACVLLGLWLDRRFEHSVLYKTWESRIHPLRDYAPGVLAVTVGILLAWSALHGVLLAPNFPLPHSFFGNMLLAIEWLTAAFFLVGHFTPAAAISLLGMYLALFLLSPRAFPSQFELFYLAGAACFLFFFSRGRYSLDWFLGAPIFSTPTLRKKAYLAMRLCLGISLIALSVLNKWLHPELHLALMDRFPGLNPYVVLHWFGLSWLTKELYVFLLFVFEIVIGIYETGGFLTRIVSALLIPVFMASAIFLPPTELIGHAPVLGMLFVLVVFGDTYHKQITSPMPKK